MNDAAERATPDPVETLQKKINLWAALLGIAVTGFGLLTSIQQVVGNGELEKTRRQLSQAQQEIGEIKESIEQRDLDLRIGADTRDARVMLYDKSMSMLESNSASLERIEVTLELIYASLKADDPIRVKLQDALQRKLVAVASPAKAEAVAATLQKEIAFNLAESQAQERQASSPDVRRNALGDADVDIFHCESSQPAAKREADAAMAVLRQAWPTGAKGRIRVRLLPDTINRSPGYRRTGNYIIINDNDGERRIEANLREVFAQAAPGTLPALQTLHATKSTPGYVSIFLCQNARI